MIVPVDQGYLYNCLKVTTNPRSKKLKLFITAALTVCDFGSG